MSVAQEVSRGQWLAPNSGNTQCSPPRPPHLLALDDRRNQSAPKLVSLNFSLRHKLGFGKTARASVIEKLNSSFDMQPALVTAIRLGDAVVPPPPASSITGLPPSPPTDVLMTASKSSRIRPCQEEGTTPTLQDSRILGSGHQDISPPLAPSTDLWKRDMKKRR
jgi:hypothetical protein